MSLAVVFVANDAVAVAADSVYVQMAQGDLGPVVGRYRKVVSVGDYVGVLTGVATHDGHHFSSDLLAALSSAASVDDALAKFVVAASAHVPAALADWKRVTGASEPLSGFMQVFVAGRDRLGGPIRAAQMHLNEAGTEFLPYYLASDQGYAYCGLCGSYDGETRRWSSAYVLEHRLQSLQRGAPTLAPRRVDAGQNAAQLEGLARTIVEEAVTRESHIVRPLWWPPDVPVLAGPVEVYSI